VKILQAIVVVSSSVAALGVLGCDVVVSDRPHRSEPVYVEQRQQQEPTYIIVTEAPPAPRNVERRPAPPAQGYVWIDGYYSWSGRQYAWEPGRWAMPPRGYTTWVGPRYDRDQRGYRYTAGYWQPENRQDPRGQPQDRQVPPVPPQERR
jgi:hypothetical protein